MSKIKIEKMTFEDIDAVDEIEKDAFPIPWKKTSLAEELTNMLATYLVAKIDEKVVGYIGMWYVLDECHITNVAVHKDFKRQGIASDLINAMLKICKEHESQYILLEVRANNIPAQNLYTKFGFTKDGVRKDYYKNPDGTFEDAILMSKEF